jgi:hypothetical protein
MNPPSATTSPVASAAAAAVRPASRRRASRSRAPQPPSRPRTQRSLAATARRSAHAAQYAVNHAHAPMEGPNPRMSEYDHPGPAP